MTKNITTPAAIAATLALATPIFDAADNASANFADKLAAIGLARRAEARPIAMLWAAKKYGEKIVAGKRGDTFAKRGTAAERAVYRVLNVCFPAEESAFAGMAKSREQDAVAKLVKAYEKLTGAEKRSFLRTIGK